MKRGFTLIELLAVIIILAIIALIATPILLNVINDSRKQSLTRSAENYLRAVEYTVKEEELKDSTKNMDGIYTISKDGKTITNNETSETFKVEFDGKGLSGGTIIIENGEIKSVSGSTIDKYPVTIENGKVKVSDEKQEDDPEPIPDPEVNYICIKKATPTLGNLAEGNYNPGDEYTCEVKESTSYTFYVLSTNDDNVNLIMEEKPEFVSSWGYPNDNGPVGIIETLNSLTGDWENIDNLSYAYKDTETTGSHMDFITAAGYQLLYINSSDVEIKNYYGNIVKYDYKLRTRLITKEEATGKGCSSTIGSCPTWLNNTWTISSNSDDSSSAYQVNNSRLSATATTMFEYTIRPVISVPKKSIKN